MKKICLPIVFILGALSVFPTFAQEVDEVVVVGTRLGGEAPGATMEAHQYHCLKTIEMLILAVSLNQQLVELKDYKLVMQMPINWANHV